MKKNAAAQALRAIPSKKREAASRLNGKKGGRPRVNFDCRGCGHSTRSPIGICSNCSKTHKRPQITYKQWVENKKREEKE